MADRFDDVVADLSGQLDAALAAELAAEVEDRTRRELAGVRLVDRLRAGVGTRVEVTTYAGAVQGVVEDVGVDWCVVAEAGSQRALVPLDAVLSVGGLGRAAAPHDRGGLVGSRLVLAFPLRRLARDRIVARVGLRDGGSASGRLERVGADFVELVPADGGRRRLVPIAALALLRW